MAIRNHNTASTPPIIERQILGDEVSTQKWAPALQIDYILTNSKKLGLGNKQLEALNKLNTEWKFKSKPIMDDLNRASANFQQFMKKIGNKASMQDIQSQAAPVSELSRQIASLRKIYWQKALQILDKHQQKALGNDLENKGQSILVNRSK